MKEARGSEGSRLAELLRLIVIADRAVVARPRDLEGLVARVLEAGCRAIQLRMKDATAREMLASALPLRELTREAGALFFVNDRLDVALAADADGVHLGPEDLPAVDARKAVSARRARNRGPDGESHFLIGYSTDDPGRARRAEAEGVDYIGCGTVYPTRSKARAGPVIGLDGLGAVARAVEIPVVGIGGITPGRAPDVARTGAAGVAVISAVMEATDPASAVRSLMAPFGGEPAGRR